MSWRFPSLVVFVITLQITLIFKILPIDFVPLYTQTDIMRRKIYLSVLFLFFLNDLFSQCAMFKAVAEEVAEEEGSTINTGILYIMVIPYIILFIAFRKKIFGFLRDLKKAGVPH